MKTTHAARSFPALLCASALVLAGCGAPPGDAIPSQPGATLAFARTSVQTCAQFAEDGGQGAVVGSYIAGLALGGLVLGPVIVAANEPEIREQGEIDAVDQCLAEQGFKRRYLTGAEREALNSLNGFQRQRLLDHLIGGRMLGSFQAGY